MQKSAPIRAPGANPQRLTLGAPCRNPRLGNYFKRRGAIILEENVINIYNIYNQITDTARQELYAKELDKNIKKFNKVFIKKLNLE